MSKASIEALNDRGRGNIACVILSSLHGQTSTNGMCCHSTWRQARTPRGQRGSQFREIDTHLLSHAQ
jgi:hypothetical protein